MARYFNTVILPGYILTVPLASENRISFVSQVGTAAQPPATLQCSAHWRGRAFSLGIRLYPQLWPRLEKKSVCYLSLLRTFVLSDYELLHYALALSPPPFPPDLWSTDGMFSSTLCCSSSQAGQDSLLPPRECFYFICLSGLVWARPASKQGQFALQRNMVLFITCNF